MKMKTLFYTLCILLIVLLQTTILHYISIKGVMPNLVIVFIIVTAFMRGSAEGAAVGFFAGLAMDMMFGNILGFYALLGFYLGFSIGSMNKGIFKENLLLVIFFTFIFSIAYEVVVYVINNIMSGSINLLYPLTTIILPEAIYNSVISILIYPLILKAGRYFDRSGKLSRKY